MTPPRKRRLLRFLVRTVLVVAVLVVGAYLLRGPLFGGLLRERLEDELSAAAGSRVTIGSIEGGWLADLTLVDVAADALPPDGALQRARAGRVAVRYRLLDLLDDPVSGLDAIDVDGLDVALHVAAATDDDSGEEPVDAAQQLTEILRSFQAPLPPVRIAGSVELTADDARVTAQVLVTRPRAGELDLDVSALHVTARGHDIREDAVRIGVRADATALYLADPVRLGGIELRSLRAEQADGGPRLVAALGVGGDVELAVDAASTRIALRGVDAAALPPVVRDLLADLLGDLLGDIGPKLPPVVVDADVEIGPGPSRSLLLRDANVVLGDSTLRIEQVRMADIGELASLSWRGLDLRVRDPESLATHLGIDLPVAPGTPLALLYVVLESAEGTRDQAQMKLEILTRAGDLGAAGTVTFPAVLDDWRALGLRTDFVAALDAAETASAAPEEWALPELVGEIVVEGRFDGTPGHPGGSVTLRTVRLAVDERLVESLDVEATLDGSNVRIARLVAVADFGRVEARGSVDASDGTLSNAAFDLDVPDLERISDLSERLPPLEGTLRASGVLTGTLRPDPELPEDGFPDDMQLSAQADADDLVVDGARIGAVTGAVTLVGPRLEVERLRIDGDLGRVETAGVTHLVDHSVSVPGFAISTPDLAALSRWLPALDSVQGSIELGGSFHRAAGEDWRNARLGMTLRAPRVRVPGADLSDITLRIDADEGRVRLHEAGAATPWGRVALEGDLGLRIAESGDDAVTATLRRADLDLERTVLGLTGAPLPFRLLAPVDVLWESDRLEIRGLDATFLGGRIRGDVARGRDAAVNASGEGLDLSQLSPDAIGRLSGSITLAGDPDHPTGTLRADVPELSWRGETGQLEIEARQDLDGLHIARCEVAAGALLKASAEGYAPWIVGESGARRIESRRATMRIQARSESPDLWISRFAPATVTAAFASLTCDAEGPVLDAELVVRDLEWRADAETSARLDGDTTVRVNASSERASAVVEGGGAGPLQISGAVQVQGELDWRDPIGSLESLPDAPLSGQLRLTIPDISDIASLVDLLRRVSGRAHVDVALSGTVGTPELVGTLAADDVSVAALDDIAPIDRGRVRATLRGRTIELEECALRLGYAPVTVSGSITLPDSDDAGGESLTGVPTLDLRAVGENVQIVRTQYTRLRADVDVTITGPFSGMLLAGRARVTDSWYTKPVEGGGRAATADAEGFQLFSATAEPFASLRFDLSVTADRTVRVDNNIAFGSLSLDMRLRGTGAVPEPEGRLWCDDVAVRLPVTRMTVESATATFRPERPFDPDVRASAFARIKGYDLDIQVSGGTSDLRVMIATSPPLSQEDALILLATGAPPASEAAGGQVGASAAAGAGSLLGEAALDWFSGPRAAGEERFTDRVQVYVGREISESGLATVETEVEIADGWFLRFERDRWEDYAAGVLWRVRFR